VRQEWLDRLNSQRLWQMQRRRRKLAAGSFTLALIQSVAETGGVMLRKTAAVVAGLGAWALMIFLAGLVIRATWPEFVAASPEMTFTLPMLITRLAISVLATLIAGVVTALVARESRTGFFTGVVLLAAFVPVHVSLWAKFPVWYHLFFLVSLIPLSMLGARLIAHRTVPAEAAVQR
jgi:hypothetical protein